MEGLGQGPTAPLRVYQGAVAVAEASEALAPQPRVVLRVIEAATLVIKDGSRYRLATIAGDDESLATIVRPVDGFYEGG